MPVKIDKGFTEKSKSNKDEEKDLDHKVKYLNKLKAF
jgi:hypothetical protein